MTCMLLLPEIYYCQQMYLRTFEICVPKYMKQTLLVFLLLQISMASSLKKAKVKLDLLTDIDILLMVKKGVSGVICHAIFLCVKDRL